MKKYIGCDLGGTNLRAAIIDVECGAVLHQLSLPTLAREGHAAVIASIVASTIALFLIGAAITLMTGRGLLFSGIRQVLIGLAAAAVTFGMGHLIGRFFGVTIAG